MTIKRLKAQFDRNLLSILDRHTVTYTQETSVVQFPEGTMKQEITDSKIKGVKRLRITLPDGLVLFHVKSHAGSFLTMSATDFEAVCAAWSVFGARDLSCRCCVGHTSWPQARYVKHAWAGAWVCSLFRNEAPEHYRSSELIRDAVAATRARFGEPPTLGMVTFVNPLCVRPKRDPGRCFRRAGFRPVGTTKGGLLALQLVPAEMPRAALAGGMSYELFGNMAERCVDE